MDDGICDCCDGSDEWSGKVSCENNCLKLGEAKRREAEKMAEAAKNGFETRISYIREASKTMKGWSEELHEQKEALPPVEKELEILEQRIEVAEKVEEEKRAAERAAMPEQPPVEDEVKPSEKETTGNLDLEREEEENLHGEVTNDEAVEDHERMESEEELDPEELGRRVASRWTTDEAAAGSSHDWDDDHSDEDADHGDEDYSHGDYDYDHDYDADDEAYLDDADDLDGADGGDDVDDGSGFDVEDEEVDPAGVAPRSLSVRALWTDTLDALKTFPSFLKKMLSPPTPATLVAEDSRGKSSIVFPDITLRSHTDCSMRIGRP